MKTMIVLALMALAAPSRAELKDRLMTPVAETALSSATVGRVAVSSITVGRIDNGTVHGLLSGRATLRLCNVDAGATFWWGYDSSLSSTTSNNNLGESLAISTCVNIPVGQNIPIYAIGNSSSTAIVHQRK